MLLTKEKLLEHRLRWERVPVPGSEGEEVGIRALPYPALQKAAEMGERHERYAAYVLSQSVVDDKGSPVFESEDEADAAIQGLDPVLVDFMLAKALVISAPDEAQREAIKKSFQSLVTEASGE